jgi:chlorite dismutase
VIGLIGKDLYPLSKIVETMRKTQQTSLYLEHLGPFFVGRVVWQSPA